MSLLHLRQGTFLSSRNGKDRFDYVAKNVENEDMTEIISALNKNYASLSDYNRLYIINSLLDINETLYFEFWENHRKCKVLNGIHVATINKKLNSIWSEKHGV